ncbi:hypothetical protein HDU97_001262 [Phlyctochytrium planicorne]|nr:hypothetical protein HDU97_001262 [Phlyctochytrium planicorne]
MCDGYDAATKTYLSSSVDRSVVETLCSTERKAVAGFSYTGVVFGALALIMYLVQILLWTLPKPLNTLTTKPPTKVEPLRKTLLVSITSLVTLHAVPLLIAFILMVHLKSQFQTASANVAVEFSYAAYMAILAFALDAVFVPWFAYVHRWTFFVVPDVPLPDGTTRKVAFDPLDV